MNFTYDTPPLMKNIGQAGAKIGHQNIIINISKMNKNIRIRQFNYSTMKLYHQKQKTP